MQGGDCVVRARYTKSQFYNEILRLYKEHGEINKNIYTKYTCLDVGFRQYCDKYGGLKQICKDLGIKYSYYNEVSKEQALERGRMLLE